MCLTRQVVFVTMSLLFEVNDFFASSKGALSLRRFFCVWMAIGSCLYIFTHSKPKSSWHFFPTSILFLHLSCNLSTFALCSFSALPHPFFCNDTYSTSILLIRSFMFCFLSGSSILCICNPSHLSFDLFLLVLHSHPHDSHPSAAVPFLLRELEPDALCMKSSLIFITFVSLRIESRSSRSGSFAKFPPQLINSRRFVFRNRASSFEPAWSSGLEKIGTE